MQSPEPVISTMLAAQIGAIWSDGRIDLVDSLYAETVIDHMPVTGQVGGRAGLKQAVELFRAAMPDLRMTLHGTIGCGDMGVDWWTLDGTHTGPLFDLAPTGRKVSFSGIDWVRVKDDQIAELWHVEEMFQMEQQLGIAPAASFGAPGDPAFAVMAAPADAGAGARLPDSTRLTATERRNLAVARHHIEGLWAAGDIGVAVEVYAPDVVDMNPAPGQRPGIAGITDVLAWLREAAPDLTMQ
ncbi:MAG: ester cyclase, partial [Polymorphobacter sp.]